MKKNKKKTWVIAEHLNSTFHIIRVVQSEQEPKEEYRTAIIEIFTAYQERNKKIPNTGISIFSVWGEEASNLIAQAGPDEIAAIFEMLKSAGKTGCADTVSIQRSAWCHTKDIDVLEYSYQNGGGSGKKRKAIVGNKDFQAFLKEKCEIQDQPIL